MTELQGAVGLAQIKKVRSVVEKRMALGNHLRELISDIDGLTPPPITEGSENGYWLFPLRINAWSNKVFAEALSKEGVSASAGYIAEPIFICMEALAGKKTFGNSTHPFDGCHGGRKIDYTKGMCPRTEDALNHIVITGFNENFTEKDIDDMAGAIRKVAKLLPK
jgi:dTDP-4-amino-4,6-dideoxygalactose transaminase